MLTGGLVVCRAVTCHRHPRCMPAVSRASHFYPNPLPLKLVAGTQAGCVVSRVLTRLGRLGIPSLRSQ